MTQENEKNSIENILQSPDISVRKFENDSPIFRFKNLQEAKKWIRYSLSAITEFEKKFQPIFPRPRIGIFFEALVFNIDISLEDKKKILAYKYAEKSLFFEIFRAKNEESELVKRIETSKKKEEEIRVMEEVKKEREELEKIREELERNFKQFVSWLEKLEKMEMTLSALCDCTFSNPGEHKIDTNPYTSAISSKRAGKRVWAEPFSFFVEFVYDWLSIEWKLFWETSFIASPLNTYSVSWYLPEVYDRYVPLVRYLASFCGEEFSDDQFSILLQSMWQRDAFRSLKTMSSFASTTSGKKPLLSDFWTERLHNLVDRIFSLDTMYFSNGSITVYACVQKFLQAFYFRWWNSDEKVFTALDNGIVWAIEFFSTFIQDLSSDDMKKIETDFNKILLRK